MAIPIEQFELLRNCGTRVLALDESGTGVASQTVTDFMKRGARECVELVLLDGRSLVCTPDHRIRTESGWVEAGQLAAGDTPDGIAYTRRVLSTPPTSATPANPADVASVDAIIKALYDVISGPAGQKRDWNRFRSLFAPGARLMPTGRRPDGVQVMRSLSPEEYATGIGPQLEAGA
jgi:hypothetical protein